MDTSTLEIRPYKAGLLVWTPEAASFLTPEEGVKLQESLEKICSEQPDNPLPLTLRLDTLEIRNCNDYVDLKITVHKGDTVVMQNSMLAKSQLPLLLSNLRKVLEAL